MLYNRWALLGWERFPQMVKIVGFSCLQEAVFKETGYHSVGLVRKQTLAYPRFSEMVLGSYTFFAVLFSWCNCISKLRFEDNITHVLGGCNPTDFHRVVFMQKRLEFILEITQLSESQASGCFKNILKIPTTHFLCLL